MDLQKLTKQQLIDTVNKLAEEGQTEVFGKNQEIEELHAIIEKMKEEVDVANKEAAQLSENVRLQAARAKETERTLINAVNAIKTALNQTIQMMDALGIGGNRNV